MVVTAVLRLATPVSVDDLRAVVADRLVGRHARFAARLVPPRFGLGAPSWQRDHQLDLARHVLAATPVDAAPLDDDGLAVLVGDVMSRPLDLAHPPWQLHLARVGDGCAVVARLHHCIADGIALAHVLLGLTEPASTSGAGGGTSAAAAGRTRSRDQQRPSTIALAAGVVSTATRLLTSLGEPVSSLRGQPQGIKRVGWSRPHDLAAVKDAARRLEVSVNDLLLAAVAGGLRRHLVLRGEPLDDVRVMMPVDLRGAATDELGNRFGVVFASMPVAASTQHERLALVAARTGELKGSIQPGVTFGLLKLVGALPAVVGTIANAVLGSVATAVVTNVPGPREPLQLAGSRLDSLVFWVPQAGRTSLGISLFSYAGAVTVGVAGDAVLDVEPADLAQWIDDELQLLVDGQPG